MKRETFRFARPAGGEISVEIRWDLRNWECEDGADLGSVVVGMDGEEWHLGEAIDAEVGLRKWHDYGADVVNGYGA